MKYLMLSMAAAVVLWIGLSVQGEPDKKREQDKKPTIKSLSEGILKSSSDKERLDIIQQFKKERIALQSQLIEGLRAAKEKDKKVAFVYLIGHYRLKSTVRELAKIIDLECEIPILQFAEPLWHQYPVVEALVNIGLPSIPAMLENIAAAKGEKITELSVRVIDAIETPIIAKIIIQKAIDGEDNPMKKTVLQNSLKYLRKE